MTRLDRSDPPRHRNTTIGSDADAPNDSPKSAVGSEHFIFQDNTLASDDGGVADEEIRSGRPLIVILIVVIVAIFIAAMAEIALSLSELSGPPKIGTVKARKGPAKLQTEAATGADVLAPDAAILGKLPPPPPTALVDTSERPLDLPQLDLPQEEDKTSPFGSLARSQPLINDEPAAAPEAPAQTQTLAEPFSTEAPSEPEKMKTDSVEPDGDLLPNGAPPQADIMAAPLPPPRPAAAAKAPTPKTATRPAKTPKPTAATHAGGHGQPRQIAEKAKAKPSSPLNTGPAKKSPPTARKFTSPEASRPIPP